MKLIVIVSENYINIPEEDSRDEINSILYLFL